MRQTIFWQETIETVVSRGQGDQENLVFVSDNLIDAKSLQDAAAADGWRWRIWIVQPYVCMATPSVL